MFCSNCGNEIEDTAQVCQWCGCKVEKESEPTSQSETVHMEAHVSPNVKKPQASVDKMMAVLGVEICVLGAGVYWLGIVNELIAFLLIGYVLLKEEDVWLRAVALKSAVIMIVFALITGAVSILQNSVDGLYSLTYILSGYSVGTNALSRFFSLINIITRIVEDIILIICGFKALKYKNVKLGVLDRFVNKSIRV